jgi:signal transduction histidine kinase
LVNLIANARSHGRPPIEIEATHVDGSVTVEVRDRGPGIPPGSEEQIFDRFHQLDPARSGEGTGLGLAIARGLAEQHGGTVTAGNRRGGGAVFSLRLPES